MLKNAAIAFPHLFSLSDFSGKFEAGLIYGEDHPQVEQMQAAYQAALDKGVEKHGWDAKTIKKFTGPIFEGNEEKDTDKYPEFKDCFYVTAKSSPDRKVPVFDGARNVIEDKFEVQAGNIVSAKITFYPYQTKEGAKGIAVGLEGIQKTGKGTPIGGGMASADEFDVLEDQEEFDFEG